jgi:hypothetical protein
MRQTILKMRRIIIKYGLAVAIKRALIWLYKYPQKKYVRQKLGRLNSKEIFTAIHKVNYWQSTESVSGPGSELKRTQNLITELPQIIEKLFIKQVIDAPCGDYNWMQKVTNKTPISYLGVDIVDDIIAKNQRNHQAPEINFEVGDIRNIKYPDADLLIVRDCLFHLSYADTNEFLNNFSKSNITYLLTTTHTDLKSNFTNKDIKTGDFRKIDLFKPPYNFDRSKNIYEISDYYGTDYPKSLVLVKKIDVPGMTSFK